MFDLAVKNGIIVTENTSFKGTLAIKDGKVGAILSPDQEFKAKETLDAEGRYILPGLIDAHVHGGHGDPDRETLYNASCAAAAGGVTTILEQPLSTPSTVTVEAYDNKHKEAAANCVVDYGLWGGLVPGHIDDIEGMFAAGGQAFKSFMCRCSCLLYTSPSPRDCS